MSYIKETEHGLRLEVTIHAPMGLHARPAAKLAQELQTFSSSVQVHRGQSAADAKSVVDMLTLGAINGSTLVFYAKGTDASDCLGYIAKFFSTGF